jgi:uncharacterized protein YbjT (DUF2867 family)
MKVVVFGASGMVGRGVLGEALGSSEIDEVISVGRSKLDLEHPKLRQIEHADFEDFEPLADELVGLDACFWCLGTTSVGHDEASYTRITHTFTMAAAAVLARQSPDLCFCFVSGAGTDAQGRAMWARVKGRTENDLKNVGFRDVVLFRPAFIRPGHGGKPRGMGRYLVPIIGIFNPLLRALGGATSAVEVGRAMIAAAAGKPHSQVLETRDINELAAA